MIRSIVAALFVSTPLLALGFAGTAHAGQYDLWQSSRNPGDYFIKDNRTDEWVETIGCREAYRFKFDRAVTGGIRLRDASRDLYVRLDARGMAIWSHQDKCWNHYKDGAFDRRIAFEHKQADGGITGTIWRKPGCAFHEFLGGTATPDFRFRMLTLSPTRVSMYDQTRNVYVELTASTMNLKMAGGADYKFFKRGNWVHQ